MIPVPYKSQELNIICLPKGHNLEQDKCYKKKVLSK